MRNVEGVSAPYAGGETFCSFAWETPSMDPIAIGCDWLCDAAVARGKPARVRGGARQAERHAREGERDERVRGGRARGEGAERVVEAARHAHEGEEVGAPPVGSKW